MSHSRSLIIAVLGFGALQLGGNQRSAVSSQVNASVAHQQLRTFKGQVLTSTGTPAVRLTFATDFKYIGTQDFILYDVARAEQHFLVDADNGRIKRLYWVQFEGYLPNNTQTYRYNVNKTINLGGFEFIADAYARNLKANPGRPDSDGNRARAFLESKGFKMASDEVISQRLVHLDEAKRNELMIIYMEDLTQMSLTASDLATGGRAAGKWDSIAKGLMERAASGITVSR